MATESLLDIAAAVSQLQAGQIIAYPTEAVYGLGCDPGNASAVERLLALKCRPESAGFILIASNYSQLEPWVAMTDICEREKAMQSWPGPVTWLFPRAPGIADYIAGEHDTIAVRITAHEPSRTLCDAFGGALISTSANQHTLRPARSTGDLEDYFGHELGGILAGALGGTQRPTEIRDLLSGKIVRPA